MKDIVENIKGELSVEADAKIEAKVDQVKEEIEKDVKAEILAETNASIDSKIGPFQEINSKMTTFQGIIEELQDSKTKTVVFHAIRNTGDRFKGDITYDIVPTNVGNVMNAGTGVFTTPYDGTYFFTVVGLSPDSERYIRIYFVKNGVPTENFIWHDKGGKVEQTLSYQWMLKLNVGDRLKLQVDYDFYADSEWPVIFTGQLVSLTNRTLNPKPQRTERLLN